MDFSLTDEQTAIQEMVKGFTEAEIFPFAKEWDENHFFPVETLKKAASLGLAAIYVDPHFGGAGLSRQDAALIFIELATGCPTTAAYLSIHNMVAWLIDHYAEAELKAKYLSRIASMDLFCSYCLTEPHAGSDAAALSTLAKREGDFYIINGAKAFISGGSTSDLYACMVRTDETKGAQGITCLLIEKGTPGLTFGVNEQKLGWHAQATTMVYFDNVRVPVQNRIGTEGQGFKIALSALNGGRINIAACSLGGAKRCIELTRSYMHERMQFKQRLIEFEALQFRFADMLTHYHASHLLVLQAAYALDHHHHDLIPRCAMAKQFATDHCFDICNQALQIHGGYGYLRDYGIERYFRDLRVHQILEGTNEIMRLIIAKHGLQESFRI